MLRGLKAADVLLPGYGFSFRYRLAIHPWRVGHGAKDRRGHSDWRKTCGNRRRASAYDFQSGRRQWL